MKPPIVDPSIDLASEHKVVWSELASHERRHFDLLAAPPREAEQELFRSLLKLQPQCVERIQQYGQPGNCHANAEHVAHEDPEFHVQYGWVDVGSYMVLHSVVRWDNAPTHRDLFCVSPAATDGLVFRRDPELRLLEPWIFERNGVEMPCIVRRDPETTGKEARRAIEEMQLGICQEWSESLTGSPLGAEPERVKAWLDQLDREAR